MSDKKTIQQVAQELVDAGHATSLYWAVEQSDREDIKKRRIFEAIIGKVIRDFELYGIEE